MNADSSDAVLALAQAAAERDPNNAANYAHLAELQWQADNLAAAEAAARTALRLDAGMGPVRNRLAKILNRLDQLAEANSICEEIIAEGRHNTDTLAIYSIVLARLGRTNDCERILGLDRLVSEQDLDELQPLNTLLAKGLIADPDFKDSPAGKSTRGGRQGDLREETPEVAKLFSLIREVVESAAANLDDTHPWTPLRPTQTQINAWGVVLEEAGHQRAHVHVGGWLSGVYYVQTPAIANDAEAPGSIVLGPAPKRLRKAAAMPTRTIIPHPGKLLLFPSYVYHQTIPTQSPEARVSIAFDVF